MLKKFLNAHSIAVTSHANPDCDALGSLLGAYWTLKYAGYNVHPVNVGPLPTKLDFLPGFNLLQNKLLPQTDMLIALDCGKFSRLGIEDQNCEVINIDHHLNNENYGNVNIVDANAPSASAVAFEYFKTLGFTIPKEAATCFYSALLADSGCFCLDVVTQKTFEIAAELVALGANPGHIGKELTQRQPLERIKLQAKALSGLELFEDGLIACIYVSQDDFCKSKAGVLDADGFADEARSIEGVELGVCLRELSNGVIRASLRSKNTVDTTRLAAIWNGGGHYKASGFETKITDDFKSECSRIINQIRLAYK